MRSGKPAKRGTSSLNIFALVQVWFLELIIFTDLFDRTTPNNKDPLRVELL